ncbi:type IVB secretion system protein IcmH/DotU [Sphingomonas alpina]|uniref:type IVB secretion system protein IcmH/DotU n=1 Tax=Sphingomonas alpina TaxID=653931 RepID=UPI0021BB8517|nr:type IVB secretion system protein IcmH/DotU [Sphingomonas alpina]
MRKEDDEMSGDDGDKTVFRPSPLQNLKRGDGPGQPAGAAPPAFPPAPPQPDGGYGAPPPLSRSSAVPAGSPLAPSRLAEDDVPLPATAQTIRNIMLAEAEPVLALIASVRSGRVRMAMPDLHRQCTQAVARFERAIQPHYSEEQRQRAKYAVCATVDDIAQNLPGIGIDGAEWARRSMVVTFFQENIGGDRFWQLVDDMLRVPHDNLDLVELYHACLAAGFEGRFRVMPDGRRRLHEIMTRLQGALPHVRSLSQVELVPDWRGEKAPAARIGWSILALAAAGAAALLLLLYIILRLMLMSSGESPSDRLAALTPDARLTLSRPAAAMAAADSAQATALKRFLAPEIREGLVKVEEDAQTVRVRTTVGQLFKSGSDALEPGRETLFHRIGRAVEEERGSVTIEGHADNDKVSTVQFPDNMALSEARAETVGALIRSDLTDPSRVTTKGLGETVPIAPNSTADGKSLNRRVEIIVPRRY